MKPSYEIHALPSNPPFCAGYAADYVMTWGYNSNGIGDDIMCDNEYDNQNYGVKLEYDCTLNFSESGTSTYDTLPKSAYLSFDVRVWWAQVNSAWYKDSDGN